MKNNKVKIITGYSDKGGSTVALINLCKLLNKNNIDCTMYGPHEWHINKCKSDNIKNVKLEKNDNIITHFLQLGERPDVKKVILSIHEKGWFPVGKIFQYWDNAVFLHEEHRLFHNDYNGKFCIIPNLKENLIANEKHDDVKNVCGVIGTIENRKQTHISIDRALKHGCEKVILYGKIGDMSYYNTHVKPLVDNDKVILHGFTDNKQEMYDSIGKVFHSSLAEVACLVKDECFLTNTEFFGNEETTHTVSNLNNDEILKLWKEVLELS